MTERGTSPDLSAVVDEFIRRLAAGENPDPDELVLAHPAHAAELEAQLQAATRLYGEVQSLPVVGRYRLAAELGVGASAVVYRAIDTATHRSVALKLFPRTAHADRIGCDARMLLWLKHPNIVQFLDAGHAGDRPYLAMELVEGGSLAKRLASGARYAPAEAARLVERLATAVQYTHEHGVIHRDIKPGNVLIDPTGEPQLTDFGLARDLTNPRVTRTGEVLGTPLYMAPEQVGGHSHRADARTDVYALGVVLYELLAGGPPFPPTDPAGLARRIVEDAPPPIRRVKPEVPATLEAICLRCLEKEPGDRFQTAAELANELRHWCEGRSRRVWRPSRAGRVRRWWRRQKLWVRRTVQAAGALALACVVLGWSAWSWKRQADVDRQAAILDRRAAELAAEKELQESRARARSDTRAALARGWRALQLGRAGRLEEVRASLAAVGRSHPSLPPDEQRAVRFEARTLFAMSLAAPDIELPPAAVSTLPNQIVRPWAVAAHPAARWLAVGTRTRPVRLTSGAAPPPGIEAPALGEAKPQLAFSPDGRFLAFSPSLGGLEIWDGELRRPEPLGRLESTGTAVALALNFSSDGTELRAGFANGTVSVYRTTSWERRERWTVPPEVGTPTAVRFAPTGDRVAIGTAAGKVRTLSLGGRPEPDRFESAARTAVESLAWTPDGRTLAAGFKEGRVMVWDGWESGRELHGRFQSGVGSLEYSPDGSILCAARINSESLFWDRTGRVLLTAPFVVVEFSRDGRSVTTSDNQQVGIGRWVVPNVIRTLRGHETAVGKLAHSADGRRLVSVDSSFEGRVWELGTGELVGAFLPPAGGFYAPNSGLALSPDGRWVAFASGGRGGSRVVIHDLSSGRTAGPWPLPGGFEHLAALGEDRFRLVREEFVGNSEVLETALYDLDPRNGPRRAAVVRPARPSDTRRYFEGVLSPDGRHYAWVGPRVPRELARVEVVDLEARKVIYTRELPQPLPGDPGVVYDSQERALELYLPTGECLKLLFEGASVKQVPAVSSERELALVYWSERLRREGLPSDWNTPFGLTTSTFVPEDRILGPYPSHNRWLVWADLAGQILVADREALFRLVADFDRKTFG